MRTINLHLAALAVLIPLLAASFPIVATADGFPPKGDFLEPLWEGKSDPSPYQRNTTRVHRDDSLLLQRRPGPALSTPPQRSGKPLPEWNEPQRPMTHPWVAWEQD